ncbi:MAG: hypothetical protein LUG18_08220 [Candidatus Azobacteroides sp.]|nr:hypothetical protein [Candidatus Azobacteroides sp.]
MKRWSVIGLVSISLFIFAGILYFSASYLTDYSEQLTATTDTTLNEKQVECDLFKKNLLLKEYSPSLTKKQQNDTQEINFPEGKESAEE